MYYIIVPYRTVSYSIGAQAGFREPEEDPRRPPQVRTHAGEEGQPPPQCHGGRRHLQDQRQGLLGSCRCSASAGEAGQHQEGVGVNVRVAES